MDEVVINTIFGILGILGTALFGYLVANLKYQKAKKILAELGKAMDAVNVALYDDKVTEEEFRKIYEHMKGIYDALKA